MSVKSNEIQVVKGTLFFPLEGFFNEVTQVKKKFKKTLSQFFLLPLKV